MSAPDPTLLDVALVQTVTAELAPYGEGAAEVSRTWSAADRRWSVHVLPRRPGTAALVLSHDGGVLHVLVGGRERTWRRFSHEDLDCLARLCREVYAGRVPWWQRFPRLRRYLPYA